MPVPPGVDFCRSTSLVALAVSIAPRWNCLNVTTLRHPWQRGIGPGFGPKVARDRSAWTDPWRSCRQLPRCLPIPCLTVFFSFLAVRFSLRFLPAFFFSLPRGCLAPICPAYAHGTLLGIDHEVELFELIGE